MGADAGDMGADAGDVGADAGVSLTAAVSAAAVSPAASPSPCSPRTLMVVRAVDMVCLAQETFRVQGSRFTTPLITSLNLYERFAR